MDGPLKKPQAAPEVISSMKKLVEFIKLELVEGTLRSTLTRTLVKNGWDKKEATLFLKQIAKEMEAEPGYVRSQLDTGELLVVLVIVSASFSVGLHFAAGDGASAISSGIRWGALLILSVLLWVYYRIRLNRLGTKTNRAASQAALFRPTTGNLQMTQLYCSWIQWARDLTFLYIPIGLIIILVIMSLVLLALITFDTFIFG